eukprot:CAMPEP_0174821866 /NCGR_PEP_ID=MMETSP1107-20130205/10652_1 /TAXON_ID=36770 /ORGANISM="Paraphysomonas vestita, Strain GFlagA" /LENGTH=92 /DNA_ID=CAMNT_0016039405 /DNA_START=1 /DNA_END=276 /DNA_ORIENTATION=+
MSQMFGGSVPTLRKLLVNKPIPYVRPSTNVREAANIMSKTGSAILILDSDELVGIFTPKDLLNRVIVKKKSPDLTAISSVMTPNPDCVSPDL